jgi:hypothetical protein
MIGHNLGQDHSASAQCRRAALAWVTPSKSIPRERTPSALRGRLGAVDRTNLTG